jgi:predicted ATPase/DNA-binding SARP family transcriptional activator/uncharacterized protein HemY
MFCVSIHQSGSEILEATLSVPKQQENICRIRKLILQDDDARYTPTVQEGTTIAAHIPEKVVHPPALRLILFGPMQVLVHGQPLLRLRSRKGLWLLALLTLRHDRPVEREWLAGTLWPDVDQSQAFANLRPVISELRHTLGTEGKRLQSPNRSTLYFELTEAGGSVDVDVLAFDAAIARGDIPALEQAAALYQGPLLEGCPEDWADQERREREQKYLRALQMLAEAAREAGNHEVSGDYWSRAVRLDPLWDTARRGWMEALARCGDRNAALHVYREFVALLRSDPTAVPDERTTALYRTLREEARQQTSATPSRATPTATTATAPPATVPAVMGYLPQVLTGLVGRDDERFEVAARLRQSRLVTLTGLGGIGKTRLSLAVAAEIMGAYADGVWFVPLESLTDGRLVAQQTASVLGLKETPGRTTWESLTTHLRGKRLLLVLDNCEHLIEASAELAGRLLRECAGVSILATSREPLGITGEAVWAVPALAVLNRRSLPEGASAKVRVLAGYESVQLFVDRARAVNNTFALTEANASVVAQICAQVEGIPLAIELAAARVKAMTVEQIAARLDAHHQHHLLRLLTSGSRAALSRQQNLRATLDWSFDLLNPMEKALLCRLSIFSGGWTLEAAEQVCSGEGNSIDIESWQILDLLTSLVDKSLVVFEGHEEGTSGRFRLLEMVRQYGAEKLEGSGDIAVLKARHRHWLVTLVEEAEPHLVGADQAVWLRRLDREHDNLRAALSEEDVETALRLVGALYRFWHIRGYIGEGREHLTRVLDQDVAQARTAVRAKVLNGLGTLTYSQGDYAAARTWHEESLSIRRELGDRQGIAASLNNLGNVAYDQGDYDGAQSLHEESLSIRRELGDREGMAWSLNSLGNIAHPQGRYAWARSLYEESLGLFKEIGDRQGIARTLCCLAYVMLDQGDYMLARLQFEESLSVFREVENPGGTAWSLCCLGYLACEQEDNSSAQMFLEEGVQLFKELGDRRGVAWGINSLGNVAHRQGQYAVAQSLHEESLRIRRELGDRQGTAWSLLCLGNVMHPQGEHATARALVEEGLNLFKELEDKKGVAESLNGLADVLLAQGRARTAVQIWAAVRTLRESIGAPLSPYSRKRHERQVAEVRRAMGETDFLAAWEEGQTIPWEQAVAQVTESGKDYAP